jgi:S-adenosylmethionine synthetase
VYNLISQDKIKKNKSVELMENIFINTLGRTSLEEQPLEITERKGLGHPDTICDSVMNAISIEISKEYLKRFGVVLHHNVDKSLLAAGRALPSFKGGKILKPMKFVFGDRATFQVGDEKIPIEQIAAKSASDWIKKNLRFIEPDIHINYQSEIKPGSVALKDIFSRRGEFLGANDTSAAVGYSPFTKQEKLIIDLESYLNSEKFKTQHPESGEDIKIMGLRKKNSLDLTIAMAMIDRFIENEKDYFIKCSEINNAVENYVFNKYDFEKVNISLNALDKPGRGIEGLYLTVLGTSAEAGDSGQVGRGNNVVGVIPLNRPISSEAAAGKNPVSHVGKIYNFLSYKIADRIIDSVNGVKENYVWLLSQIGKPINEPSVVSAQIIPEKGVDVKKLEPEIKEIIAYEFEHLAEFCDNLANGLITVN